MVVGAVGGLHVVEDRPVQGPRSFPRRAVVIRLMNSAVMPAEGTYRLRRLTPEAFGRVVRDAHESGVLRSYVGYPQTADMIACLAGVPIPVSRDSTQVEPDVLLIARLRYRVDPGSKGAPVDAGSFEFFACHYTR